MASEDGTIDGTGSSSGGGLFGGLFGNANFLNSAEDLGGAVGSIFSGIGGFKTAAIYTQAANLAGQNVNIEEQATAVKVAQEQRQLNKTIGAQRAEIAGAGFAQTGTATNLMRDSLTQGGIAASLIRSQGAIQENAYREQQLSLENEASSAKFAGIAGIVGGLIKGAGAVGSLFGGG